MSGILSLLESLLGLLQGFLGLSDRAVFLSIRARAAFLVRLRARAFAIIFSDLGELGLVFWLRALLAALLLLAVGFLTVGLFAILLGELELLFRLRALLATLLLLAIEFLTV